MDLIRGENRGALGRGGRDEQTIGRITMMLGKLA